MYILTPPPPKAQHGQNTGTKNSCSSGVSNLTDSDSPPCSSSSASVGATTLTQEEEHQVLLRAYAPGGALREFLQQGHVHFPKVQLQSLVQRVAAAAANARECVSV